ncbi:uncharacterized protein CIMG_11359 [Coccidioides immitis RS]|uniref:Uncharacterized protein n=1 Tax=Coccidioides immitis (strain RS) TaxID=246410 RepID=A0A0D8JUH7_COCIM|nr:uncharacterized protein CIMG_11359 [Coccidioides immitis RS]KJF61005.1 hypothetical protein CIMG_11359 [Coccidioides immitis RS]
METTRTHKNIVRPRALSSATITIQTSQVSLTKNLQEIKVRRDSQASDHKQGYPGNLDLTWVIKSGYRLTHNADLARVQALCSASIQGQKRGGQSSVDVSLPRRLRGGTTRPLSAGSCPTVSNLWRRSGGNKIFGAENFEIRRVSRPLAQTKVWKWAECAKEPPDLQCDGMGAISVRIVHILRVHSGLG